MVLMAFTTYARPRELLNMRVAHLLEPVCGISQYWAVFIAPQEEGVPTKTGAMDDSLLLDDPSLQWLSA
eukprot:2994899-Lingulodinium_polyedra.AAC.1